MLQSAAEKKELKEWPDIKRREQKENAVRRNEATEQLLNIMERQTDTFQAHLALQTEQLCTRPPLQPVSQNSFHPPVVLSEQRCNCRRCTSASVDIRRVRLSSPLTSDGHQKHLEQTLCRLNWREKEGNPEDCSDRNNLKCYPSSSSSPLPPVAIIRAPPKNYISCSRCP
ncbi:hypothetical protein UY3_01551 [Chelonia mydas]|uniref:Uncharacterized protein n=1 Tax=Chelonia mydas TaxID=8469 RepID=M7C997_CHEMY|nr:hypothetical protein UY3_01551 [Chelonia mydas]